MIKPDLKYKIPVTGRYAKMVYECPYCNHSVLTEMYKNICGIADAYVGLVKVIECPQCHEKYYSHISEWDYDLFLDAVESKENLHFK